MKPVLEHIAVSSENSMIAFRYAKNNFETPWHFHPQHELNFIEASTGTKFVGDYVGPYEPGELVLLRANLPHCWKNFAHTENRPKSIVVQWNNGVFAAIPELDPIFKTLKRASKGLLFEKSAVKTIAKSIRKMPSLNGSELYVVLLDLLLQLSTFPYQTLSESSFTEDLPSTYNDRMSKIHDFVEAHYGRKIYLKELAETVNMTEQSFSRFFSKMMGRPFFTFLNEYRINMAARLLIDTDRSISEIGYLCGYESPPFFFKKFQEMHGLSPAKYRRKFSNHL